MDLSMLKVSDQRLSDRSLKRVLDANYAAPN